MNDLFNENQQEVKQDQQPTRPVSPVSAPAAAEVKSTRRRRTERFAGLIDEADSVIPAEEAPAQEFPAEEPAVHPSPEAKAEEAVSTRTQPRVPMAAPSQGVPRPSALSGQQPHRAQSALNAQGTPIVRRPVNAEGYAPLPQLGEQPRARRPEPLDVPRRVRNPQSERIAYEDVPEEEEHGSSRGLIAVIIALLVLAALILGLIMIPEDDAGVLGTVKRAVTAPIKGLFGGDEESEKSGPATASGFTATVSQATAPYKVVFQMVTSSGVTAVRVVDAEGNVLPTTTTLSAPNSESTIVWMFEMTRDARFEGSVRAQIQDGANWVDTGLSQQLSLGVAASPTTIPPTNTVAVVTTAPSLAPTDAPVVEEETATPMPEATPAPVEEAPTDLAEVTATPTMSVTATPTMVPTATPTAEPTEEPTPEPTAEPTPEPTPEPTEEPTPTPVVTPKLEAMAAEAAAPSLITKTEIYSDGRKVNDYERDKPMNMPASDEYLTRAFGVTTFRGNAFRQNAAVGNVENPTSLSLAWTVEAGSAAGSSRTYYGIGWTGQPVITRWSADVRQAMNVNDENKAQKNLKEVILAGMDGKIYFLDLLDGQPTRDAIDFGYPMRSTPSLHPLGYPMMTFGQYARKMKSGTGDNIGLYYYSLMNQKQLRLIDGLDRKLTRAYYSVGAFDTSALIDRTSNTLIAVGTNGLLYTEKLSMRLIQDNENNTLVYEFSDPVQVSMMSHTKNQKEAYAAAESSLAMYANYAYYADMDGILRCVDTTTMTTAWAVDTGDAVRASIALDLEEGENSSTLWLYTANLVLNNRNKGDATIRRFNAMTGEEDWAFAIHCAEGKKKDVTFNNIIIPGAMASPVIGQHGLDNLVYFTLSSVSATGAQKLDGSEAMAGVIIAFNKETGEVVWHKAMDAYCYSSPVAVYNAEGEGWIIQACSNGTIYLMDGLTGDIINTLAVNGVIEGSPAVYDDMLVIGTTGKNTSYIYGIEIK